MREFIILLLCIFLWRTQISVMTETSYFSGIFFIMMKFISHRIDISHHILSGENGTRLLTSQRDLSHVELLYYS